MSIPFGPEDQPTPGAVGASAHPDETVAYIPKSTMSPAAAERVESQAQSARYDFLDAPQAPGELGWLAHYRVHRCIGEGGMGLVFEAEDTDLLRPVALKVIRPELAGSPQVAQRFRLEGRAMAALKHDHIVTIYQVGQQRGVPFLAMEYLRGISLADWLAGGHKPSLDLVLRIGREIASGLAAAHRQGLIHRDIKPANIWLEAPLARVKILDFGLARITSHDVQITNPGTTVGSPAYMAPEQARGEGGDAACDLFSLGCVLYHLSTGRRPFPGTTVMAVLTSLSADIPQPARERNPALPPAFDALVMRLLAKDPADRPASAQAVVHAIKDIERALLTERRQAKLAPTTSLPAVVSSTRQAPADLAPEPQPPHPAEAARAFRYAGRIATAVAVLGLAMAAAAIVIVSRGARTIAMERPAPLDSAAIVAPTPAPTTVAATSHGRAVSESGPTTGPADQVAPPKSLGPLAVSKVTHAEATLEATPDRGRPPRENLKKPRVADPPPRVQTLADGGHAIDPDGDCLVVLERETNQATIMVTGTAHLLSAEIGRMNAPRIVRGVSGNFEVRVRVTGTSHPEGKATTTRYAPYHGAGILIWQDPENYVRLELAADLRKGKRFPYANFELRQAGRLLVSRGLKIEDGSSHLQLQRRGAEIHGAFSSDGDNWTSFPPITANLAGRVEVGVVAVNSSSKPLKAEFATFQVTGEPGTGAEGEVDTGGPGPPQRSPSHPVGPGSQGTLGRPGHRGVAILSQANHLR
jgi:serine/threonine protein kinase/regulation of enolase protein 1 (concanavalin A-like superfamily)